MEYQGLKYFLFLSLTATLFTGYGQIELRLKGDLIYENKLSDNSGLKDWIMEGPGVLEFPGAWMVMHSPEEKGHHVIWCPLQLPSSFIARWEAQNLEKDAGLCIVFFAAFGSDGQDIFHSSMPKRDGTFKQYTKSKHFNNYHISYYANTKDTRSKGVTHLRKNAGFHKVQVGELGIPLESDQIHEVTLIKQEGVIKMFIDDRLVIDWVDEGKFYGEVLGEGRIGFRQMKWTKFQYRDLKIWGIDS